MSRGEVEILSPGEGNRVAVFRAHSETWSLTVWSEGQVFLLLKGVLSISERPIDPCLRLFGAIRQGVLWSERDDPHVPTVEEVQSAFDQCIEALKEDS